MAYHPQWLPGHVLARRYRRNLYFFEVGTGSHWIDAEWLMKKDDQERTILHEFMFDPEEEHTIFSVHPQWKRGQVFRKSS